MTRHSPSLEVYRMKGVESMDEFWPQEPKTRRKAATLVTNDRSIGGGHVIVIRYEGSKNKTLHQGPP